MCAILPLPHSTLSPPPPPQPPTFQLFSQKVRRHCGVAGSVFPRTWQRDPKSLLLTSFFFLSLSHVGDGGYSVVVGEGDREGGVRGYDAGAIKN